VSTTLTTIEQMERPGFTQHVKAALQSAVTGQSALDPAVLQIPGMSGRRYRMFINALIGLVVPDARYLEVGSWQGSTLCSAISGHSIQAIAIDNWSEFGGPRDAFMQNVQRFRGNTTVYVIEQDFRKVDYGTLGKSNVFLFDGPHNEIDQYDGIVLAQPALDRTHVLIVDDWNLQAVRDGTFRALTTLPVDLRYTAEIRTTLDNSHPEHHSGASDWHNGYFLAVVEKR
jgi:hypothetical protein